MPPNWPVEDDRDLVEMRASGVSLDEMAEWFGRSKKACEARLRRLKCHTELVPWTPEEIEALKDAKARNIPITKIGLPRSFRAITSKMSRLKKRDAYVPTLAE